MATPGLGVDADLNGAIPFNADSQWNIPVANAPLLWDSAQIMASINTAVGLHPDFGSGTYYGIQIGIPYVVVPANQPLVPFINNLYTAESDPGPFPIPDSPPIEGTGGTGYNDNHLVVLQLDANGNLAEEYDFFQINKNADGIWQGYSIKFDLTGGDDQIPMGWTSANAAGLPEFAGLVTYDEVQEAIVSGGVNGHLNHALAFSLTAWNIGRDLFGAAEHETNGGGAADFGMRFVLNPDFQIDQSLPIEDIVILNTLKLYGMILEENGANFFLAGAPDPRWNNANLALLQTAVSGADFRIVDTTGMVPPAAITVGTGADSLVLQASEDAYQGNAQFTVTVDGSQIGGVQTILGLNSSNQTQTFTFRGDWGSIQHAVTINFLNAYGDANGSRDMLLQGVSYDGSAIAADTAAVSTTGSTSFIAGDIPTVGSGPDLLKLHIYETAYQGDAQFTVSVDGVQVGGVLTVALPTGGRTEEFDVYGNWGSAQHTVTVQSTNELSDAGGSRNLFIWGMNYDGTDYNNNVTNLWGGGAAAFLIGTATPIGTGPDSLVLHLSETAYQGDAQFTFSVDGIQIGGVETETLLDGIEDFTFQGNWGSGQHSVVVNFVNGLSGAGASRNLYVEGMNYDGTNYGNNAANLYGGGTGFFMVGTPVPIGSGPDSLVLQVSEIPYQGNAQFTVSVDGIQIGGVETIVALNAGNETQAFTFLGDWGTTRHVVTVNAVNAASDMLLQGVSYDGTGYAADTAALSTTGTTSFTIGQLPPIGTGSDSLVLHIAETAYQGDAQFTVSVDGTQIGGIQAATPPGNAEDFTFQGNWGSGQHTVVVNFVNGLSVGGVSRNLFIRGMSYDGTDYHNNVANLWGGGVGSFLIGPATPVGSGPDSLVLHIAETADRGDAQFTVSVDGTQVGGIETATLPGNVEEDFTLQGNWGSGQHTVVVNLVNGQGEAGVSRNLFIRGMSYDGTDYNNNVANLWGGGVGSFLIGPATPVGSGPDSLVLHIAETADQGDAQFTVSVDGTQVGGIETATLPGNVEDFTFKGNWGSGQHTVVVNLVNGQGDAGVSRNLFVEGMSYDGTAYASNTTNLYGGGSGSFLIGTPGPIGSGSDSLVLHVGETAYQGDAQFTVSVDGTQIGGVETATLSNGIEDFTFQGNWGSGQHTVLVNFTNGLSGAGVSRNLYVEGMNYDGTAYSNNTVNLYGGGIGAFLIGPATPIGTGSDSLVLHVCEAAYQGDAQFTVSVDGTQVGGTETATLPGALEDFTFLGDWGAGQHSVVVNFTNGLSDAGGARNLFIEGMKFDGANYAGNTLNLYGGGSGSFVVGTAAAQPAASDTIQVTSATVAAGGNTSSLSFLSSGASGGTVSAASTDTLSTSTDALSAAAATTDASSQVAAAGFTLPDTAVSAASYAVLPSDTIGTGAGSLAVMSDSSTVALLSAAVTQNQQVA